MNDLLSTNKKVDAPDQFVTTAAKFWVWVHKHLYQIGIGAGIVVIVAAIWFGADLWNRHTEAKADAMWDKAIAMTSASPEQVAQFEKIADEYSRRSAGRRSLMRLGNIFMKKDAERARKYFTKLAGISSQRPLLEVASLHGIAETYAEQKKWDDAAASYLKAAALPGNLLAAESRFEAGLCHESAGKKDEARAIYKELSSDEKSPMAARAKERLLWLDLNF